MSSKLNAIMNLSATGIGATTLTLMARRKCKNPFAWAIIGGFTLFEATGTFDSIKTLFENKQPNKFHAIS